jgi:mono/diheme cytochrome c family protein/rhodanese-related sulfurtransferase
MRASAVVLAGLLACLVGGCPKSHDLVEGPTPAPQHGDAVAAGKKLYDKYCKLCHGEAGQGYTADNASQLANPDFLATASDPFLFTAIEQGRPGTAMAAYGKDLGGPLAHDEIRLVMVYLHSLAPVPPKQEVHDEVVEGDAAAGEEVWRAHCARCHGARGEGKSALSLNNPMFLASASDGFIRYAIEHGRKGTPMPAFGDKLGARKIGDVTRLIRSWARNVPGGPPTGEVPPRFDAVVINPDGPQADFGALREGRFVPADAVKAALDGGARMILLDARPISDWLRSHIPGALPVPYYDPDKMTEALPNDGTWIIAYCACPHAASGVVMDNLRKQGFKNTAVLDEGILIWTARGYPLTFGATP